MGLGTCFNLVGLRYTCGGIVNQFDCIEQALFEGYRFNCIFLNFICPDSQQILIPFFWENQLPPLTSTQLFCISLKKLAIGIPILAAGIALYQQGLKEWKEGNENLSSSI